MLAEKGKTMADHKSCKHYNVCDFRNDTGSCPNSCVQYKHKDIEQVVRCKDCIYRKKRVCANPTAGMWVGVELKENDFCSYGERKNNEDNI